LDIFCSGPAPPFVPRRKDHAIKIINAEADPFPSLHKTIMPKGPLLLPANQMMSQGITLNAPQMMMFASQQRYLLISSKAIIYINHINSAGTSRWLAARMCRAKN